MSKLGNKRLQEGALSALKTPVNPPATSKLVPLKPSDIPHNTRYQKYSHDLQDLYHQKLLCEDVEELATIKESIKEKVIEALLDWDLGRSDLHALGRLINLCENRECPSDAPPEIQYLPQPSV